MMKKRYLFVAAVAVAVMALSFGTAFAELKTVVLGIPDVCASKSFGIDGPLKKLGGISGIETDLDALTCTLTFDDSVTDIESIKQVFEGIQLPVTTVEYMQ